MSKRRGFTLVEVLVVVAITTVVLGMVGGLLVFMTNSSRELIVKSEEIMLAQSIEKRLRSYVEEEGIDGIENEIMMRCYADRSLIGQEGDDDIVIVEKVDDTFIIKKAIFNNTGLDSFSIYVYDVFVKCKFAFKNGGEYDFILGKKP